MLLHCINADERADNGTQPTEDEDAPPPITDIAHGNERYRRVAAGYIPIYCRVVELAQEKP